MQVLRRSSGQAEYVGRSAKSRHAEGARMEESFDLCCHLLPPLHAGQSPNPQGASLLPGQRAMAGPNPARLLPGRPPCQPRILPLSSSPARHTSPNSCPLSSLLVCPPCAPDAAASKFTRRGRPRCSHCLAPKLLRRRVVSPRCQPCGPSSLPLPRLSFPDPA
jgi:hypothetical protein